MNLDKIIEEIEKHDPEVYNRLDTRRHAMKSFARIGGRLALTAIPLAFGSMLKKAYAGTNHTAAVIDVLNYALKLEYLEAEFYQQGVTNFAAIGVPAGAAQTAITKIAGDEANHVIFLKKVITDNFGAGAAIAKPAIDLTGGMGSNNGPFKTALSDYGLFLAVAQTFEDTGVRAYKGRAGELKGTDYLTAALNIHSVEARHAAHIRSMRYNLNVTSPATSLVPAGVDVKSWITLNQSGIGTSAVQPSYDGATPESNTSQAGINIIGISGNTGINNIAASEAFDEPLTETEVLNIVKIFFA